MGEPLSEVNIHESETSSILPQIPVYDNDIFSNILENAHVIEKKDGKWVPYKYSGADEISIWWRDQDSTIEKLQHFSELSESPQTPKLESNQAKSHFEDLKEAGSNVNMKIKELIETFFSDSRKTKLINFFLMDTLSFKNIEVMRSIEDDIKEFAKLDRNTDLMIAVLQEITVSDLPPQELRQRVAQHTWTEFITLIPYAVADNEKIDIIDEPEIEKMDFKRLIKGDLWDEEKTKKAEEYFDKFAESIKNTKNEDLINNFTLFYKCTQGKHLEELSVFDLLKLQNDVWQDLYSEDAFTRVSE
jgi:hypothetical protein